MNPSQLRRALLQVFLLPIVALLLLASVFIWQTVAGVRSVEHIQRADRNISYSSAVMLHMTEEETALRGFQITGNEIFLQPYTFASAPWRVISKLCATAFVGSILTRAPSTTSKPPTPRGALA
ncbi:hypothetical protein ACFQBQ_00320 [Granulicella cerasi]|uniref:Uncharacterized protein n=1 Tax=Granulicella cerasi TaxID=741063 RepID=A0ABW1Z7E4_9BACT